ncbi:23S rRNA (adenine(1618)-N(6))-methyltransferase RlmF [Vibrio sp.]|uniref:23S rRNA (adenine(1618)-N(6))-methyltransferase RlmF n=1 Tax=Vibrio sp. TaxID=678 RepID=UPI003D12CE33
MTSRNKRFSRPTKPKQADSSHRKPAQKAAKPSGSPSLGSAATKKRVKSGLHPRNRHRHGYDFAALVMQTPQLKKYLRTTPGGETSVDFADPTAVKLLNKALLACHYQVEVWDIPAGYLCPPIPGRADYIHRLADLLNEDCPGLDPKAVQLLDIGVGASCIYPIIACQEYQWRCIGSDIDPVSVKVANQIVSANAQLSGKIDCRLQSDSRRLFTNIIQPGERIHLTCCNPPFHKSLQEAEQGTKRKLTNLQNNRRKRGAAEVASPKKTLNFGGQKAELWCPGGEAAFIKNMAHESHQFADQVLWFSSLISKKDNVRWMRKQLDKAGAKDVRVVEMQQGQKVSRFIAWSFKNETERHNWLRSND